MLRAKLQVIDVASHVTRRNFAEVENDPTLAALLCLHYCTHCCTICPYSEDTRTVNTLRFFHTFFLLYPLCESIGNMIYFEQ